MSVGFQQTRFNMKTPLQGSSVILLFLCVTGTYQTIIPKNELLPTPVSILQENNKCYTVDDAADFCNAFFAENGNSNERLEKTESEIKSVDLYKILKEISEAKKNASLLAESSDEVTDYEVNIDDIQPTEVLTRAWRIGTLESQNEYFLESGRYSDISFEVGSDNNTQIIYAHKLLLVRGSPVFEEIIDAKSTAGNKGIRYRIKDINASAFNTLLQFIYSGKLCFKSFDEACEMLSIAAKFQMPDLAEYCHYYIWLHMYPRNLWGAYQCAVKANDTTMLSVAIDMIDQKTDLAVMDSAFTSIPKSTLIAFLSRYSLNVSSELVLYQAALRWAMAEATRRGLPQDPESLRECLGEALEYIRFLTLTPNEFANIQYTSKILTYSESLAVIFNLNAPGVMPLPSSLSSSKESRKSTNLAKFFKVYKKPLFSPSCKDDTSSEFAENIFDVITTVFRANQLQDTVIQSIKIPKAFGSSCSQNVEFSIAFLDSAGKILHSSKYSANSCSTSNSQLYNVKLSEDVIIPNSDKFYKIKVVFHNSGSYPLSVDEGASQTINRGSSYRYLTNVGQQYFNRYEWKLGKNNFVYSISNYYE